MLYHKVLQKIIKAVSCDMNKFLKQNKMFYNADYSYNDWEEWLRIIFPNGTIKLHRYDEK